MQETINLRCKNRKCGATMSFEVHIYSTHVDIRADENVQFRERFHDGIQVICKECRKPTALIGYQEMKD